MMSPLEDSMKQGLELLHWFRYNIIPIITLEITGNEQLHVKWSFINNT